MTRADSSFQLTGKVALVTGGSRGLGREIALGYADAGADVIVASRKLEACEEVAAEIRDRGRGGAAYAVHIGHWAELEPLAEFAFERFGRLDVLVNNAGMSPLYDDVAEIGEELFDKVVGVNLKGPFRLTALVGKRMVAAGGGSIVNISSSAAVRPRADVIPYAAAKAGLNAMTQGFADAFVPAVRVNAILAGPFSTDIADAWEPERMEERLQHYPLRRSGRPEEILGAALLLASDASSYITGSVVAVDGGASFGGVR